MKKVERHGLIKQMIKEEKLGTQKEIQDRLEQRGIFVTQTTLSRDLRELALTKVKKDNKLYYITANETSKVDLVDFLSRHIQGVDRAEFTLVFHTRLGEAAVLANAVDKEIDGRILGTVAGADTLLVICRDAIVAKQIEEEVERIS